MDTRRSFISLLLALFACLVNAALHVQPATLNKDPHASFDGPITTQMEREPSMHFSVLSAYKNGHFFTDCVAYYANEMSKFESVSPSRMAIIRRICDRHLGAVPERVSAPIPTNALTQTGMKGMSLGKEQNRNGGNIFNLLHQAEKATLQYIFSRLRKVLGRDRDKCRLPVNSKPRDFDGTNSQKERAREILRILNNSGKKTVKEVCKELRKLLKHA